MLFLEEIPDSPSPLLSAVLERLKDSQDSTETLVVEEVVVRVGVVEEDSLEKLDWMAVGLFRLRFRLAYPPAVHHPWQEEVVEEAVLPEFLVVL